MEISAYRLRLLADAGIGPQADATWNAITYRAFPVPLPPGWTGDSQMIEIILNRWDMVMALNLVPLLALELHFRAQDRKEPISQISVAVLIAILTVFMGAGMFATTKTIWLPSA